MAAMALWWQAFTHRSGPWTVHLYPGMYVWRRHPEPPVPSQRDVPGQPIITSTLADHAEVDCAF